MHEPAAQPTLVYLAGPEVFLPNAVEVGRLKKEMCARHGLVGLFPFDNEVGEVAPGERIDRVIYEANVAMMRRAHCAVLNLTPFRGPGGDSGTVFELGFMSALGKPIFGYTNEGGEYVDRLRRRGNLVWNGRRIDVDGLSVEDFGNADNLMLDNALLDWGAPMLRHPMPDPCALDDLTGFEACLQRVVASLRPGPDAPKA